jgi:hypothetical protein
MILIPRHKRRQITYEINETGCHICTSHAPTSSGYPRLIVQGRPYKLSHIIYEREKGEIPVGHVIRHTCDTPQCINPLHLVSGTHADNVKDRVERNRSAVGEKNGRAKLTVEQVREIRNSRDGVASLARKYGVSPRLIKLVRDRKVWKTVL